MTTKRLFGLARVTVLAGLSVSIYAPPSQAETTPHMHDMMVWTPELLVMSEVLEYAPLRDERPLQYDLSSWVGGDVNRVWLKAEGQQSTEGGVGDTALQLLYGRLISPYWDVQFGVRVDVGYGAGTNARALAVLGLEGLAPGWFDVEPAIFVSHRGDLSASLTASYDLYVTQRLVAQPRVESAVALQEVPAFGVGSGINNVDLGLRLRYEISRQFAPYLGVTWERQLMETADLARSAGADVSELSAVVGLRLWY
jgi:copper resistance protein B